MDDRESAAMLRDYFRHEADLYRRILGICRSQSSCIAANDQAKLMELLGEKQELMRQIDEINSCTGPLLEVWHDGKELLPEEDRHEVEASFAELKSALAEVVAVEDECQRQLARQKPNQGAAISAIHNARSMAKAYGAKPPSQPSGDPNGGRA